MTKNVEILNVKLNSDGQSAMIEMTKESEQYIQLMFPSLPLDDAIQAYWELAASHLDTTENLKV